MQITVDVDDPAALQAAAIADDALSDPLVPTVDEAIGSAQGPFSIKGTYRAGQPGPVRVGQIFTAAEKNLTPQYLGKKNGPTRVAVENVINRAQTGDLKGKPADVVWAEAVKEAEKVANS